MSGGGFLARPPLVPSAADGRHIPERDERHAEQVPEGDLEDEEETMDRWIGVAVMGALVLVGGLGIYEFLLHTTLPSGSIAFVLADAGIGELVIGTLLAFVFHPPSISWVAVASFFTVSAGVVCGLGGVSALWVAIDVLLAVGVLFTALAGWRIVVTRRATLQDELEPVPS